MPRTVHFVLSARRTIRRAAASFVPLTLALGAGVTAAPVATATTATTTVSDSSSSLAALSHLDLFESRILARVNRHRNAADLRPVRRVSPCLDGFAERWARHLAATGEFRHRDQHRILRRCDFTWAGENLVRGTGLTPRAAVRAWMHSPAHRAVLLKPRANRAGIGVRLDAQGRIVGVLNLGDAS
jgi:uncharacterized protein YkwD